MTNVGAAPVYGYLYVPNPQTGNVRQTRAIQRAEHHDAESASRVRRFAAVTLPLTAADIWHTCFGGSSEPWTRRILAEPIQLRIFRQQRDDNGRILRFEFLQRNEPDRCACQLRRLRISLATADYLPKFNNSVGGYFPFLYLQAQIKL